MATGGCRWPNQRVRSVPVQWCEAIRVADGEVKLVCVEVDALPEGSDASGRGLSSRNENRFLGPQPDFGGRPLHNPEGQWWVSTSLRT
jgi:hypothetical protein